MRIEPRVPEGDGGEQRNKRTHEGSDPKMSWCVGWRARHSARPRRATLYDGGAARGPSAGHHAIDIAAWRGGLCRRHCGRFAAKSRAAAAAVASALFGAAFVDGRSLVMPCPGISRMTSRSSDARAPLGRCLRAARGWVGLGSQGRPTWAHGARCSQIASLGLCLRCSPPCRGGMVRGAARWLAARTCKGWRSRLCWRAHVGDALHRRTHDDRDDPNGCIHRLASSGCALEVGPLSRRTAQASWGRTATTRPQTPRRRGSAIKTAAWSPLSAAWARGPRAAPDGDRAAGYRRPSVARVAP